MDWKRALTNAFLRLFVRGRLARTSSPEQTRARIARLEKRRGWKIPRRVNHWQTSLIGLNCEWFVPDGVTDSAPLIIYYPGGGFFLPAMDAQREMLVDICQRGRCRGVLVQYRLVPEYRLPQAQRDGFNAYQTLLQVRHQAPSRMILLGDSAGGNVALSTLHQIKMAKLPPPAGAMLLSPATDMTATGESLVRNADRDPFFCIESLLWMRNLISNHTLRVDDPLISPAFSNFSGCPPLLIEVGSTELLFHDSQVVAERAMAEGVEVRLTVAPHVPHVYPAFGWLPDAQLARARMGAFVRNCCP